MLNGRNLLLVVVLLLLVTGKGAATSEQIRPTGSMCRGQQLICHLRRDSLGARVAPTHPRRQFAPTGLVPRSPSGQCEQVTDGPSITDDDLANRIANRACRLAAVTLVAFSLLAACGETVAPSPSPAAATPRPTPTPDTHLTDPAAGAEVYTRLNHAGLGLVGTNA